MYCLTVCTGGTPPAPYLFTNKSLMILQPREWLLRSAVLFLKGKLVACFLNECLLGHWAWWHALAKLSLNERQRGQTVVHHDGGGTRLPPKFQASACNRGPRAELWHLGSSLEFISVQSLSCVQLFVTHELQHIRLPCPSPTSRSNTKLAQTHVHRVSDAIQPSHPLSSPFLPPSIFPRIRVFSSESVLHIRWPKYWRFSFSTSPSNEYSGLISFRMDWLDLPAVQGTLKSLLQYHSSKASILWCSTFFIVQLSHPYTTTGKTIALTRQPLLAK